MAYGFMISIAALRQSSRGTWRIDMSISIICRRQAARHENPDIARRNGGSDIDNSPREIDEDDAMARSKPTWLAQWRHLYRIAGWLIRVDCVN